MEKQTSLSYDRLSQILHWLTAVAVTIAFILGPGGFGRLMRQGVDPGTRSDIVWHESLGVLVFLLTIARLVWLVRRPARPTFSIPPWMNLTSRLIQGAMWVLMLVLPLTAILSLGSEGHPLTLLGGLRIERMPIIADSSIAHVVDWGDLHGWLGDALMWIAGLHAAAAIFHRVVLKDGVLAAMLPFVGPPSRGQAGGADAARGARLRHRTDAGPE